MTKNLVMFVEDIVVENFSVCGSDPFGHDTYPTIK
jgi:hypothetical protein